MSRSEDAQHLFINGSVKTVAADARGWIQYARRLNLRDSHAGCCVHWQVEGDPVGGANGIERRRLAGKIGGSDVVAFRAQPGGGRGKSEWLPSKVVC